MITVPMTVATNNVSVPVAVSTQNVGLSGNVDAAYYMGRDAPYEGDYEFTPTQQQQVIQIAGKAARQDIIINPIPSNYGLITYNGSFITVS